MGYSTDFYGRFDLNKTLTSAHKNYLEKFADTRRMKRDAATTSRRPDPLREAVGLPVGTEGGYFVNEGGCAGQGEDLFGSRPPGVTEYNSAPAGQPGLWCQWVPTDDGAGIQWNGSEKFYNYCEWLTYLINHFLKPWGYVVNGKVRWEGEDSGDLGTISVKDNVVSWKEATINWN